jgi:thiol-disulfide isomerase/thioredoxin
MNKKINMIVWIIAIAAIIIAAYIFYSQSKSPGYTVPAPTPSQQNKSTDESSTQSNKTIVPDFDLKDLNGQSVKLSDYNGKIVILNFWATWCTYCKKEMPDLNDLNMELAKNNEAVIITVDVQESSDTVKNYLSSNNINLMVLLDQDGALAQSYGISGFPTTLIVNKDGTLYTYIPGMTNKATLTGYLNKIKNGEPAH